MCRACRNAALRAKTAGRPKKPRAYKSNESRVWSRISPEPNTGCWFWLGACNNHGYGQVLQRNANGGDRQVYVHRLMFAWHHGRDERSIGVLDHRACQTPLCCNPRHLEEVTTAENCRRGRRAKITKQDAVDIRRRSASGETYSELGAVYGLHPSYVYRIVKRYRWTADMADVEGVAA